MLRRLDRGQLPIDSVINGQDGRDRFARLLKSETIVLLDECSRDIDASATSTQASVEVQTSTMTSKHVMSMLLMRLKADGCQVRWLEGIETTVLCLFQAYFQ